MQLLDHISITVRDLPAAIPFYKAVMASLGAELAYEEAEAIGFGERNSPLTDAHSYISIFQSAAAVPDPRRHYCFKAYSTGQVQTFYQAALDNGGSDAGEPGPRLYHSGYYAAFVLDPEGNKLEVVFHRAE